MKVETEPEKPRSQQKDARQTKESAHPRAGERLRVALIGCGAISQQLHLPILGGHEGIQLAALVDRDLERARILAKGYKVGEVYATAEELSAERIDAVVIATPPFHHAPCSMEMMRRGIHVLVEKPMAIKYDDAVAMARTAQEHGVILAVGFFRRLLPSMRLLKSLVNSNWLGRPVGFEAEGGGFYTWAAATLGNMRKESAGGGALIDFGSHLLDLLNYLFPGDGEVLAYHDNARGGIEADCELRLRLYDGQRPIDGTVHVARTRKLGNLVRVICENGTLEFQVTERYRIAVRPNHLKLTDGVSGEARDYFLQAGWSNEKESSWYETVRTEIDDWIQAIRTGCQPQLSGESALPMMKVMEECYLQRQPVAEPWVEEGLSALHASAAHGADGVSANGKARRVLVTGATGFIGSRVAEMLALGKGWDVRALVHNPGSAARLARLPVEMVQGELTSKDDAARLVKDCDAVVHCAIGTEWGNRRKIFDVTVGGTRTLGEAALGAGVKRFIHISTMSVHGNDSAITGMLDDTSPVRPAKGSEYGESKASAEEAIQRLVAKGLSATIFRPARVYGPFSRIFITRPIEGLAEGRFRLVGNPDVPANMLYVDNLVHAMILALQAPDSAVKGEAFILCDSEEMTWREFYEFFASGLGLPSPPCAGPKESSKSNGSRLRALAFWRWPGVWLRGLKEIVTASEFRDFGKKIIQTHPVGTAPRWLLTHVPGMEHLARRLVGADGSLPLYRRPSEPENPDIVVMGSAGVRINSDKARRLLKYTPLVARERALELTLEWIKYARLV